MNINNALSNLNEEQLKAVLNYNGPCMILAGPGSGKTFTLTNRVAYMINQGVNPENILLFTFTNKAAKEIRDRIGNILGQEQSKKIAMGTYHSICNRLLRKYGQNIGLSKNFTILDEHDCEKMIDKIIKQNGFKDIKSKDAKSTISCYKSKMISSLQAIKEDPHSSYNIIYQTYEKTLLKNQCVDFDNLIFLTVHLLTRFPNIKKEINDKYKYIIADEAHDSSLLDIQLIINLVGDNNNLCMIMDNDQSIFGFRGAKIDSVMSLKQYYNMKVFTLCSNYRSTHCIVNASRSLIDHNPILIEKNLKSMNEEGNPIIRFTELSVERQADRIVKLIRMCVNKYKYSYSDIAILYRNNKLNKEIEKKLLKNKIPFTIKGGIDFFNRKEIKDLLSYVIMALNPYDGIAFERAIQTPKRAVGPTTIVKIYNYCVENNCNYIEGLKANIKMFKGNKTKVEQFLGLAETLLNQKELSPYDFLKLVIDNINYYEHLKSDSKTSEEADGRIENVETLLEMASYCDDISEFYDNAMLRNVDIEDKNVKDSVSLMTMHSSKGLEWNVVILASLNEGIVPTFQALSNKNSIEEERRLFYVACTRAKKLLFLINTEYSKNLGQVMKSQPSRFLYEIDKKYVHVYTEKGK